jgi:hypothetical protein
MTTASVAGRSQVAPLPVAAARLTVLMACLMLCLGCWWAFAQVILRVVA